MRAGLARHIPLLLAVMCAAIGPGCKRQPPSPATRPATQPATAPVARVATTRYVDVIRASYPQYPSTQPLDVGVDLPDAGHFVLADPIYLGPRGDLWIARSDAPPIEQTLRDAADHQVHIVPHPVEFVQWFTDPDTGKWYPRLITQHAWRDHEEKFPLAAGRNYRWSEALAMNEQVVVPTDRGVSVFTFSPHYKEDFHPIVSQPGHSLPRVVLDGQGFLAFSPWQGMEYGGDGAVRYIEGQWIALNPAAREAQERWPAKLLHVVPLLDGSALQFYREQLGGPVKLAMGLLDAPHVDEKKIEELVDQLSDDDPAVRNAANVELERYGIGSWPILERLANDQPPEARIRIARLLSNRIHPTLGGRKPLGSVMDLADRFSDGGVLLYLPEGVSIPQDMPDKPADVVTPAWISIRPGRPIELLDPVLVHDAQPGKQHFFAYGNEWVVSDAVQGPRRLAGNHLQPLLHKDEAAFDVLVGLDRRGRWLFRKSADASKTLILDPTLPDVTPKLPVWQMWIQKGSTGWSRSGFPVIKRGGAWALDTDGWHPLPQNDATITSMPPMRHSINVDGPAPASSRASSGPATKPLGEALLVDSSGRYFDGKQTLTVVHRDGTQIVWPLPERAVGSQHPTLLRTEDGKLYLFNEPGRVVRISPTPGAAQPFRVDAVFTHNIPQGPDIRRIWLDPAGRIVMAYQDDRLAIMFPQGRIPPPIKLLIPADELDEAQ